jgi:hypothetical protein
MGCKTPISPLGPWGHSGLEGNRLDALVLEARQLPLDVRGQMGAGVFTKEAVIELTEELAELGLELSELLGIHGRSSLNIIPIYIFVDSGGSNQANLAL